MPSTLNTMSVLKDHWEVNRNYTPDASAMCGDKHFLFVLLGVPLSIDKHSISRQQLR